MNRKSWARRIALSAVGLVAFTGAFVGVTAAGATLVPLLAPAGVEVAGQFTVEQPAPDYRKNAAGQSFGSLADATSPNTEPDLILVVATNGKEGYVKKTELDKWNGHSAWSTLDTKGYNQWAEDRAQQGLVLIPVYGSDGKSRIGEFPVNPGGTGDGPLSKTLDDGER
jgi:hypothetical protein